MPNVGCEGNSTYKIILHLCSCNLIMALERSVTDLGLYNLSAGTDARGL